MMNSHIPRIDIAVITVIIHYPGHHGPIIVLPFCLIKIFTNISLKQQPFYRRLIRLFHFYILVHKEIRT